MESPTVPNYRRARVAGATYFLTLITHRRQSLLTEVPALQSLRRAIREIRRERWFDIDAMVVLPDHLHVLITLPRGDDDYATRLSAIKRRVSQANRDRVDAVGSAHRRRREIGFWQRRFWEHLIRDEDDFLRHADYIHFNPVKHGLVNRVRDWPYSTFHRYVERGVYPIDWAGISDSDGSAFGEPR
jgi:putative transposase